MREYGKVSPKFWTGETGKRLKKAGSDAVVVGLYLMTCPHANMLGLYYLPTIYLAHETGLGLEGASEALRRCIEAEFCDYDAATEIVWVHEMAKYQIAEELEPLDKRCKGVQNEYNALPDNPFLVGFFEKYNCAFNMTKRRGEGSRSSRPSEAPSKALASQEQEQEQKQEQEDCAELDLQAQGAGTPPPVVAIPLNDGSEYGINPQQVEEWSSTYPNVDVVAELKKMRQWSIANPRKRKTRRGVMSFANSWLSKEQDKPSRPGAAGSSGSIGGGEKYL